MSLNLKRTGTGYDGAGTFKIGRSTLHVEGHLDRQEIERLRSVLAHAEDWVHHHGQPLDTSGADFLDVVSKGAGILGSVANSPIGDAAATFGGPYGALAVAAARGAAPAIQQLTRVLGPSAGTVAALSHPDPAVQARARPVVDAIMRDAKAGNPAGRKAQLDLTAAMVKHKDLLLAERASTIQKLKDQLAVYGDPLSYADTAGPDDVDMYGFGTPPEGFGLEYDTGAPAGQGLSALHAKLDRALGRAQHDPQPTFRRRPGARG